MSMSHAHGSMTHLNKYRTLPRCRQSQLLWSKGKDIRGKRKIEREREREREREKCIRDKCDCIEFMLESVRIQQQTTFLVRSLGCSSSWSSEGFDVAAGLFRQRLVA